MIVELKPYPTMKDSGVEWLGEVPEHWEVAPNRALFDEIKDRDCPDEQMLSVTIRRGVIKQASLLENTSKKDSSNLDRSKYKLVQPGDIAYNKMRAWQGAIGVSSYRGIISPAYVVQRPRNDSEPGYFHQLFRIPSFAKEAERWSYGITSDMWSLRPEHFRLIYSCLPPFSEQAAIVRYLGHVNRRVRRLVQAKRKLIALLTEQKQAIIHRAVTLSLDPDVPLKDSGVDWLGKVPEHWEVTQVRRLIKAGTTVTYGIVQAGPDVEGGTPYIRTSDMKGSELPRTGYLRTSMEIDASYRRSKVEAGDLVVAIRATLGKALIVPQYLVGANLTQGTAKISPGPKIRSRFLFRAFNSRYCQEGIAHVAKGTTFLEITLEALRRVSMVLPPLAEQDAIVQYIDQATADIDDATDRAKREIELINEYRIRLITDVVTGKIDVRDAAAAMPEIDPLDAEDEQDKPLDLDAEADLDDLDSITEEAEA